MRTNYASQYRDLWENHWWWRSREAFLLERIGRIDRRRPCREILDVGCGDGLFFEKLARFGEVDGLEPDARLIGDGPHRALIEVGGLGPDFQPRRAYDLVLMLDVLEHIADESSALASARSALRPGGTLLLTVPAIPWLWSRHDEVNEHHRRYVKQGLRGSLAAAGFVVESIDYFFFWTVGPLLLRRFLAPADGTVREDQVAVPPPVINRAFSALSRLDHAVGKVLPWPIGGSLIAVARRADRISKERSESSTSSRAGLEARCVLQS